MKRMFIWIVVLSMLPAVAFSQTVSKDHDQDVKALGSSAPLERKTAIENLQKAGVDAIPSLLKGLDDTSMEIKVHALQLMRQVIWKSRSLVTDQIAEEIGRKGRSEPDITTRHHIVGALSLLKGAAATRELKWFATSDTDQYVRRIATHYVADVSPNNETQFFRKQTLDKSVIVQLAAYIQLAKLGDISGHQLALKILKSNSELSVRQEALDLLGAIGDAHDIPTLKSISDTASDNARFKALHAYMRVQLHQLPTSERLPSLLKSLDDKSPEIRRWAYIELYHSPDPATNDALRKYLSEPGHRGRKEARDALSVR